MVTDVVQNGEPMAWRGFGIWPIRPEFGQDSGIVSSRHQIGGIRFSRGRVDTVAWAWRAAIGSVVEGCIGFQRGGVRLSVAAGGWTDVPHHAIVWVEESRPKRDHGVAVHVDVRRPRTVLREQGGFTRVMVHLVFKTVTGVRSQVLVAECPRRDLAPFGGEERLGFSGDWVPALVDEQVQRQRLPPVHVHHAGVAWEIDNEGRVQRFVDRVGIVILFVGSVLLAKGNHLCGQMVAQSASVSRTVVGAGEVHVVTQRRHVFVVAKEQTCGLGCVGKTMPKQAVHSKGDGFVAR